MNGPNQFDSILMPPFVPGLLSARGIFQIAVDIEGEVFLFDDF